MSKKQIENSKKDLKKAKALAKYIRISPRKMRLVVDIIRYKHVMEAKGILMASKKKAARIINKVLKSAVANAKGIGLDVNRLYVSGARSDAGPTFKRFMTRSMGRADKILKRTAHLTLELAEGNKAWEKQTDSEVQTKSKKKALKAK